MVIRTKRHKRKWVLQLVKGTCRGGSSRKSTVRWIMTWHLFPKNIPILLSRSVQFHSHCNLRRIKIFCWWRCAHKHSQKRIFFPNKEKLKYVVAKFVVAVPCFMDVLCVTHTKNRCIAYHNLHINWKTRKLLNYLAANNFPIWKSTHRTTEILYV